MSDEPPEIPPEVVIYEGADDDGGDDSGEPGGDGDPGGYDGRRGVPLVPGSPRAPRPGHRRAAMLVIGAVLIFAVGVVVGNSVHDDTAGQHASGGTSTSSRPGLSEAGSTRNIASSALGSPGANSRARTPSSMAVSTGTHPTHGASTSAMQPGDVEQSRTVTGVCGQQVSVSGLGSASGAKPLPKTLPWRLVAGPDADVIDTADGSRRAALSHDASAPARFVTRLVRIGDVVYVQVGACQGGSFPSYVKISATPDASSDISVTPLAIDPPDGAYVTGLVPGDDGPWVRLNGLASSSSASSTALMATDGSREMWALPQGFQPRAGTEDLVIGSFFPTAQGGGGSPRGAVVQIYSLADHGIVDQIPTEVAHFLVGDGEIVWQPSCSDAADCSVHRYNLDRHAGLSVQTPAIINSRLGDWLALSPDGQRVAMIVPASAEVLSDGEVPPSTSPIDVGVKGPPFPEHAKFGLAVRDFDAGTVTRLGGDGLGTPRGAAAAFSPDSKWLFVAVATQRGTQVLAYGPDLAGPYTVASLKGAPSGRVPLAVLPQ